MAPIIMEWLTKIVGNVFGTNPSRRKRRVRFSRSTVLAERERILRTIASPVPFQNFLNEVRLAILDKFGKDRMTLRESALMRKSAMVQWRLLTDRQKEKYNRLASSANCTRGSVQSLIRSNSWTRSEARLPDTPTRKVLSMEQIEQILANSKYLPWRNVAKPKSKAALRSKKSMATITKKRKPRAKSVMKSKSCSSRYDAIHAVDATLDTPIDILASASVPALTSDAPKRPLINSRKRSHSASEREPNSSSSSISHQETVEQADQSDTQQSQSESSTESETSTHEKHKRIRRISQSEE